MANQIYESTYVVSSFHAVNADTGEVIESDEKGNISAKTGDRIQFKSPDGKESIDLNTITFFTGNQDLKVQINDNEVYPLYVMKNSYKTIQYIRVYEFKVLNDCTFYFEGLASK